MKTSVGVEKANFFVHYECDDETVKHVLKLDGYDGDEEECWVLLELTPAAVSLGRNLRNLGATYHGTVQSRV